MSYAEHLEADARLVILRELARQTGGSLNENIIVKVLDAFGYHRSREWVRTQLRKLDDVSAVRLTEQGTVMIASITRAGLDHVERRSVLEGVARPSPEA
ncbi:VpaChn25_0724 family phage protein [Mesorhizobium australicum]|uniref:Uncharacterized protein n=1 Tax=Mesorhizobium australicum TaxID=536018 RepID=A0A1X7NVR1_9HYPH|nr:hypothetical protein [Mesorhizobium australicum]SMH42363.1 hypothetical protein SAMN02982922_2734 [Mesorhizobium australicum]